MYGLSISDSRPYNTRNPDSTSDKNFNHAKLPLVLKSVALTNNIYHQSPMQIEKSQPKGKRIMPELRFTLFPALSIDPRIRISRSVSEFDV